MIGSVTFTPVSPLLRAQPAGQATSDASQPSEASATELGPGESVGKSTESPSTNASQEKESQGEQRGFGGQQQLTTEEELEIRELKARDREVRAHEQAHVAAGGQYVTGGPSYEYDRGPDGRQYAVGGEVNISVSPERDPAATVKKAQVIRRAALAPADPSGKDRQVASKASAMERNARAEMAEEAAEEVEGAGETDEAQGSNEAQGPNDASSSNESADAAPRAPRRAQNGSNAGEHAGPARATGFIARANPYASLSPAANLAPSESSQGGESNAMAPSFQSLDMRA